MCGIAGVFTPSSPKPVDPTVLRRMADALKHRGPDEEGFFRESGIGFGVRRLSIVDIQNGQQPIFNEDGTVVGICNGEIYNYKALKRGLVGRGHEFRAEVDVEVLVHLYEEQGPEFLADLNGQFALAIYDRRKRLLLLARDHAGIAPLFYTWCGDTLVFGSEIKAVLEHGGIDRHVDLTALDQVLTFPGPVSPRTLFRGIHSLPPAHYMCVHESSQMCRAFWDLEYPERAEIDSTAVPNFGDLAERLQRAVDYRLQADVPVGCYLSGGLDSSLIAALVHRSDRRKENGHERHAFSIAFEAPRIDERRYQDLMARAIGANHHTQTFTVQDMQARLWQAVRHAEAPLKESYNACSLLLSNSVMLAGLKVVLTGEGADELFGGYVGYRLDDHWKKQEDRTLEYELERQLRARMWGEEDFQYERNYSAFHDVKAALYSPELAQNLKLFDCCRTPVLNTAKLRGRHPLHQRSYVDFKLRLADHLLADHGDRVAYANSVEARYPYLDTGVIDWVRHAPPQFLNHGGKEKYPLRKIGERYLPAAILDREKFGFVAPSCAKLLQSSTGWVDDLLSYERISSAGYFNADTVERLKVQYRRLDYDLNTTFDLDPLMVVLTFEIFRELFHIPAA